MKQGVSDFAGYYTASSIVVHGVTVSRMYDDAWFVGRLRDIGLQDTLMIMYVNPPPVALVMTPLVSIPPVTAKFIWNCVSILLAILLVIAGRKIFDIPEKSSYEILFLGIIFASIPFLRNLQRGQIYVTMLALVFVLFRGIKTNNAWMSGGALAVLLVLKYFGWMFLIWFAVTRRWKDFFVTVAIAGAVTIGMILWFGAGLYEAHFQRLFFSFANYDVAATNLPSVPAFFGGLFVVNPEYNPSPIVSAPALALSLTIVSLVVSLGFTLRVAMKNSADACLRSFFALLTLSVLFTPLAAEHHYLLLMPALWYTLFSRVRQLDSATIVSSLFLAYLLFGWFPSVSGPLFAWYSHLSAYPHLFGAILLWGSLLWPGYWQMNDAERVSA